MTDKATVDMTSPVDGTVVAIHGEIGQMMPVGSVLVEMEIEGEGNAAAETVAAAPAPSFEPAHAAAVKPAPVPVEAAPAFPTRAVGNPPLDRKSTRLNYSH